MQKSGTFSRRVLTIGVLSSVLFWTACSSPRLSQSVPAATSPLPAAETSMYSSTDEPAMASTSARTDMDAAVAAQSATRTNAQFAPASGKAADVRTSAERQSRLATKAPAKKGLKAKLATAVTRMIVKKAVKRAEKIEMRKRAGKDVKQSKAAKAIETPLLLGIIAAVLGLLFLLLPLGYAGYVLGVLFLLGGITLIVLSVLEVI